MRTLLLAPQPFFQTRGTPIAVDNLLGVLSEIGETVDVVTYAEGSDVHYPGVTLYRVPRLPFVRNIRPGLSWKKLVADVCMVFVALRLVLTRRYQYVYAVEESVFIALMLKVFVRIPYVYDMDSSLVQQMVEKHPSLRVFEPLLVYFEGVAIRHALVVVPVCDALREVAERYGPAQIVVLYDVPVAGSIASSEEVDDLRKRLNIEGLMVLYAGNLETYQGIDLLLEGFAEAKPLANVLDLVIIGGLKQEVARYQEKARVLEIEPQVHFLGPRPVEHLASYLAQADILASPRIKGKNTPMKIYSYMDSGKPILATRLQTHTQILSDDDAVLTEATPSAFAEGLKRLASDGSLRAKLGQAGQQLSIEQYNRETFEQTVKDIVNAIQQAVNPAVTTDQAT